MTVPDAIQGYEFHLKEKELSLKEKELELKKYDVDNAAHEMHNTFLREVRARVDSLVKSLLLIGGGALTISIGNFLRPVHPLLSDKDLYKLKVAWILLFGSMVLSILLVLVMIISSALHGDRWGKFLKEKKAELEQPKHLPKLAWFLGVVGVIFCCAGLGMLALVAISTLR